MRSIFGDDLERDFAARHPDPEPDEQVYTIVATVRVLARHEIDACQIVSRVLRGESYVRDEEAIDKHSIDTDVAAGDIEDDCPACGKRLP